MLALLPPTLLGGNIKLDCPSGMKCSGHPLTLVGLSIARSEQIIARSEQIKRLYENLISQAAAAAAAVLNIMPTCFVFSVPMGIKSWTKVAAKVFFP